MLIEYDRFSINEAFLPALFNGDYTGLDIGTPEQAEKDRADIAAFLDRLPAGCFELVSDEACFAKCEVCGLMANCHEMALYCDTATL